MSILSNYRPKRSGRRKRKQYSPASSFITDPISQGKPKPGGKSGGGKPYGKNSRVRYFGVLTAPDGTEHLIRKKNPPRTGSGARADPELDSRRFGRPLLLVPDARGRLPADLLLPESGPVSLTVWEILWHGTRQNKGPREQWSIDALWGSRDCDTREIRMHPDTPHYQAIATALADKGILCRYW